MHAFWLKAFFASPRNFSCYRGASRRNWDLLVTKFFFQRRNRWWLKILDTDVKSSQIPYTILSKSCCHILRSKRSFIVAFFKDVRWRTAITLPWFAVIQSCLATHNLYLNDLLTPTSSSCNRWEQRGRKITNVMPFSLAQRMESRLQ